MECEDQILFIKVSYGCLDQCLLYYRFLEVILGIIRHRACLTWFFIFIPLYGWFYYGELYIENLYAVFSVNMMSLNTAAGMYVVKKRNFSKSSVVGTATMGMVAFDATVLNGEESLK